MSTKDKPRKPRKPTYAAHKRGPYPRKVNATFQIDKVSLARLTYRAGLRGITTGDYVADIIKRYLALVPHNYKPDSANNTNNEIQSHDDAKCNADAVIDRPANDADC